MRASTRSSASAARSRGIGVLHLGEAHDPRVRVHAVARVEVLGRAEERREAPVEPRDRRRSETPGAAEQPEHGVLQHHVAEEGLRPSRRARLAVGALGGEREGPARVGHHERLPVVVRVDQLVETRQHVVDRARLVEPVDREGGHAAQRDGGDRSQGAERDPRRPQLVPAGQLARLAAAVDQPDAHHARGQVSEAPAGPVGGGRERTRERLLVDVALVLHREPAQPQLLAQLAQGDAGLDGHVLAVDVEDAPHPRHVDHHAVRAGDVREGMARAGDLHPLGAAYGARELLFGGRPLDSLRSAALLPSPIGPGCHPGARAPGPPPHLAGRGPQEAADSAAASILSGSPAQWASASIGVSRR